MGCAKALVVIFIMSITCRVIYWNPSKEPGNYLFCVLSHE